MACVRFILTPHPTSLSSSLHACIIIMCHDRLVSLATTSKKGERGEERGVPSDQASLSSIHRRMTSSYPLHDAVIAGNLALVSRKLIDHPGCLDVQVDMLDKVDR